MSARRQLATAKIAVAATTGSITIAETTGANAVKLELRNTGTFPVCVKWGGAASVPGSSFGQNAHAVIRPSETVELAVPRRGAVLHHIGDGGTSTLYATLVNCE